MEEACHGAAILAGVGVGIYKDIIEACEATIAMSDTVVEPVSENVRIYNEKQQIFRELFMSIREFYPRII